MARVPVTVKLPALSEAMLELANVFAPVKMLVFAKYAMLEVPDKQLMARPEIVAPVKLAEEVTVSWPMVERVLVSAVKTPVLGVVAPIGVLSMVPPLIVRALATIASVILLAGRATVPVTLMLPTLSEAILEDAKVFDPVKMGRFPHRS